MSLINDMLQDLDRRGARRPEAPEGEPEQLLASSGFASSPGFWWPGLLIMALVVAVLAATLLWLYGSSGGESPSPALEPEQDLGFEPPAGQPEMELHERHPGAPFDTGAEQAPPDIRLESRHLAQALLPRPDASDTSLVEEGMPPQYRYQRKLEEWLARGREALERDRLTRPANDNAYDHYQQVLALDPDQPQALAGLRAIQRRYRELVERELDDGNLDTARTYIRRARSIGPDESAELEASAERLERLVQERGERSTTQPDSGDSADAGSPSDARLNVRLRPDLASRDRRRAEVARQLWEQGDRPGARAELERTLVDFEPFDVPALETTLLLIELYLEAEDFDDARALLDRADYLPGVERNRLEAQMLLHRGDVGAAVTQLESGLEAAGEHELYRALLARLYFAEERLDQAVASYQALLRDFGNDPAYWLGLGLAEDARDSSQAALNAFRRALDMGQYPRESSIRRFLERRIDALARELNAQDN